MTDRLEFTVTQAAQMLGVSTRSVLNYIKHKEIEAVKVGKSWFIKGPSLDAFQQRHGFSQDTPTPTAEAFKDTPSVNFQEPPTRKKGFSISKLRAHQLCCEHLKNLVPQDLTLNDLDIQNKISILKIEALEYLGAGYYAYGHSEKQRLYNKARECIGGILSLYYFSVNHSNENPPSESIKNLEELLLPAFSALIKKIEKGADKKKKSESTQGGS